MTLIAIAVTAPKPVATVPLKALATQIANIENQGSPDPTEISRLTENARLASGCGHVHIYLLPVPQTPPDSSGGMGMAPPQDPLTALTDYIKKNYKPEYIEAVFTDHGQNAVIVAAWAC